MRRGRGGDSGRYIKRGIKEREKEAIGKWFLFFGMTGNLLAIWINIIYKLI